LAFVTMYLGIDIGGTFTDLVLMDEGGNISTAKAPTTPGELEKGVFDAVAVAAGTQGLDPEELLSRVTAFGHGTTQATNALIERTGATTGLIGTRGFGDTLALQRLMGFTAGIPVEHLGRYSRRRYPDPIVPRRLIREVRERVDQAGNGSRIDRGGRRDFCGCSALVVPQSGARAARRRHHPRDAARRFRQPVLRSLADHRRI
jgi:N-methylhydantoinase A/oxoprolinase/acetone carboxylase beta subunit